MLRDVLLGLLRDGSPRHGYDLVLRYRTVTGVDISPGSIYRDVAALAGAGRIERAPEVGPGDERRIPYVITDLGRRHFDRWLRTLLDGDYLVRLPFLELLTPPERMRFVEGWRTTLAARSLAATHGVHTVCNDATVDPAAVLAQHRLRLLRAESELVDHVGRAFEAVPDVGASLKVRRLAVG